MGLLGVILGSTFQLGFGFFAFMLAIFGSASVANSLENPPAVLNYIFTISILVLPLSSLLVTGYIIYTYNHNGSPSIYWLHLIPVVLTALYFFYLLSLGKNSAH